MIISVHGQWLIAIHLDLSISVV